MCNVQTRFIPTYCTVYTTYKLLQHVSATIRSHPQGVHTKIVFRYKYIKLSKRQAIIYEPRGRNQQNYLRPSIFRDSDIKEFNMC